MGGEVLEVQPYKVDLQEFFEETGQRVTDIDSMAAFVGLQATWHREMDRSLLWCFKNDWTESMAWSYDAAYRLTERYEATGGPATLFQAIRATPGGGSFDAVNCWGHTEYAHRLVSADEATTYCRTFLFNSEETRLGIRPQGRWSWLWSSTVGADSAEIAALRALLYP